MDLDRYVTDLRRQLVAATERGGDETRALVEWLGIALESATRLVLIEALSDAAAEVSASLAPAAVEVRMRGREPELVALPALSAPVDASPAQPASAPEPPPESSSAGVDDAATSRTTLRLPDSLKDRAEQAAQEDGLSLNAWLVRAIAGALDSQPHRPAERLTRGSTGNSFSGWVR